MVYLLPDKAWKSLRPSPELVRVETIPRLDPAIREGLNTGLLKAIQQFDPDQLKALLLSGADPNCRDSEGRPAFFSIANLPMMRLMVESGANLKQVAPKGRSILFALADHIWDYEQDENQLNVVKYCLRHEADPSAQDDSGTRAWDYMRRSQSCHDAIPWDLETRLLAEDPGNPLLAKESEIFDLELEGPRVHLEMTQPGLFDINGQDLVRWQKGVRWYPSTLRERTDGTWQIGFEGELIDNKIFAPCGDLVPGSLRSGSEVWFAKKRDGSEHSFPVPKLKAVVLTLPQAFQLDPDEPIAAIPLPSLEIPGTIPTFRGEAKPPRITSWLPLPPEADPHSGRIRYGKWLFRRNSKYVGKSS
jgi:hypothetical protein